MTKNNKGFTLVETSVAAVLVVSLGAGILALQYFLGDLQVRSFNSFTNVEGANRAIKQMEKEIRTARQGDNGAFLLESAANDSFTFYSDIDFDGNTDKVTYTRSGTTLTKRVIKPVGYPVTYPPGNAVTTIISDIIQNSSTSVFSYYNGDWPEDTTNNPLPTPANLADIKLVRIYLRLNNKSDDTINDYVLDTNVNIRMVKTNL